MVTRGVCPKGRRDKSRSVEKQEVVWRGRREPRSGLSHTHAHLYGEGCVFNILQEVNFVCVCLYLYMGAGE